ACGLSDGGSPAGDPYVDSFIASADLRRSASDGFGAPCGPYDPHPRDPGDPHDPQPGDPQPGAPQPGDPQPGDPQPGDPQPGGRILIDPTITPRSCADGGRNRTGGTRRPNRSEHRRRPGAERTLRG